MPCTSVAQSFSKSLLEKYGPRSQDQPATLDPQVEQSHEGLFPGSEASMSRPGSKPAFIYRKLKFHSKLATLGRWTGSVCGPQATGNPGHSTPPKRTLPSHLLYPPPTQTNMRSSILSFQSYAGAQTLDDMCGVNKIPLWILQPCQLQNTPCQV